MILKSTPTNGVEVWLVKYTQVTPLPSAIKVNLIDPKSHDLCDTLPDGEITLEPLESNPLGAEFVVMLQ